MTQYEYVQELSNYMLKNYDTTVTLSKDEQWFAGYHLEFSGRFNKSSYFIADDPDWKEALFAITNNVIQGNDPRKDVKGYL